jgi:hypothetical protein
MEMKDHIIFYSCQTKEKVFGTRIMINKNYSSGSLPLIEIDSHKFKLCIFSLSSDHRSTTEMTLAPRTNKASFLRVGIFMDLRNV